MSKPKVLVAMSGGVDSSVAAALLVEQGYDVVGVTMQVWDYTKCEVDEGHGTCCSSLDVDDARDVADKLGFPFYVLNCENQFKEKVINPFIDDYLHGRTPSPCVDCNTFLKFDHLIRKMNELGCDYLATGHYAKIRNDGKNVNIVLSDNSLKDQTYFLFTTDKKILRKILFPVGHLSKQEVRAIAEEKNLLNSRKKDSVGICFVGKESYSSFIEKQIGAQPKGRFKMYPSGVDLGEHKGIHHFTYGQRRGIGLAHEEPLYVIKIDPTTHTVWVGEEHHLFSDQLTLEKMNWLDDVIDGEELLAKIRFHHKGAKAKVFKTENSNVQVHFVKPVRAITPGQAVAFYRQDQLVGGGWIQ